MNAIVSLMLGFILFSLPLTAKPKSELLDKLVSIRVVNNEINADDVESLFPEMVSKGFVLENLGSKQGAKSSEVKSVNYSKLLMSILNAIGSQERLKVSNNQSLLSSIKRGEVTFQEIITSNTLTKFRENVSPKSAPQMSRQTETTSTIQTDVATLQARFPELISTNLQQVSRVKQSPEMLEEKKVNLEKVVAKLLSELQEEAKHNSIAEL